MSIETLYTRELLLKEANSFKESKDYKYQYQFLLKNDLLEDNIPYQMVDYATSGNGNATILYVNMVLLGLPECIAINERLKFKMKRNGYLLSSYYRSPTHHVIPMKLREDNKIKSLGINLNDGRNGIILPHSHNADYCFSKGSSHGGSHDNYTKEVYRRITNCKSEDELWAVVDDLKWELYEGKISLN